jgi:hypothetical protein
MITVDIKPARRRFSNRKQWKFIITAGNGEPIDPRDTYANVGDIRDTMRALLVDDEVQVRVHYGKGTQVTTLRKAMPL